MERWRRLVAESFARPRSAAREVIALRLPREALIQAAAAVTALGMVLGYLALKLAPAGAESLSAPIFEAPLLGAAIQFGVLIAVAVLTHRIGRLFGGTGELDAALALVVWLNAMLLVLQVVQLVLIVVLPPLAGLIAVAAVVWALWAFANFTAELHGFQNPLLVLGGVILTAIVLFFGVAMLLAILGITPQEPL